MSNGKFLIEELVGTGPADAEWQPIESLSSEVHFISLDQAIRCAKTLIRLTEHGESGVRVWDADKEVVAWDNIETKKEE